MREVKERTLREKTRATHCHRQPPGSPTTAKNPVEEDLAQGSLKKGPKWGSQDLLLAQALAWMGSMYAENFVSIWLVVVAGVPSVPLSVVGHC
jgi:hypothetical protein